ncbi:MAG: VCBS repeat-containing protein [Acidimicrobiia bacterium]|nr:VCBS repeat-containing protein [Acidimicrobiia bacterium]
MATALALVLIPLVLQVAPASAAGSANLRLVFTASSSTRVGMQIYGNLSLMSSTSTPSGTATFKLYAPTDPTCTSPIFVSTVPVSATWANSARFTTTQAGTYRWEASYSGDATYGAAGPTSCAEQASAVIVDKADTRLSTTASPSPTTAAKASAALTGGFNPTGTLTFLLTGPDDTFCSGATVFSSTATVNGNGTYNSGTFVPTRSGKYTWRTSYNGDANNLGEGTTPCLTEAAAQTVNAPPVVVDGGSTDKASLTVFRPATGVWYVREADDDTTGQVTWGRDGDIPVAADYNGDGRIDIAVYRPSSGQWLVKGIYNLVFGTGDDIPVPGDYNGDGKADIAVWRPSTGQWFVRGMVTTTWGMSGDVPVPGDYDADGTTDIAVFRPNGRMWLAKDIFEVRWGWPGDIPVPGDYNGDGRTDIGVWRPSTGAWYVPGIMLAAILGADGDIPQPGDYDGDGRVDTAVYRPSTGVWSLRQTTAGLANVNLGIVGDVATSTVGVIWSQVTGLLRG